MGFVPKILIVSTTQETSPLWAFPFTQQRLSIVMETNPANTIRRWNEIFPDLVIFNIDSEALAIELVSRLREEAVLPILLLTNIRSDKFMLDIYRAGVDECILKPIPPALFHAKVKAWMRRSWNIPADVLDSVKVGAFHLVPSNRTLAVDGRPPIHLTSLELRLLYYLMGRPGHTVTADELCYRVWGTGEGGDLAALKNLVYRLRHKIEADPANPRHILNVAGVGYQFVAR